MEFDKNTYIGYYIETINTPTKTYKTVCSNDQKHKVNKKDNFCSVCGSKTEQIVDRYENTSINLSQFSFDNDFDDNIVYRSEEYNNKWFFNYDEGYRRVEDLDCLELSEEFFKELDDEFNNNSEIQDFISLAKEKFGEDNIIVKGRQLVNFYL